MLECFSDRDFFQFYKLKYFHILYEAIVQYDIT